MKQGGSAGVILAAGQGKRMNSKVQKQFLELGGYPLLYYSLKAFEESDIDTVILVTGQEDLAYCRRELVERFGFQKIKAVVPGGKERYHSVFCGLKAVKEADYVLIHDGARPFVTGEMIHRALSGARKHQACAVGMPAKDTVKIADENGFVAVTPNRDQVWTIQTPQAFSYSLIYKAYETLIEKDKNGDTIAVTDDAMAAEIMCNTKVKLVKGSYENIKITTPSDLAIAQSFLSGKYL